MDVKTIITTVTLYLITLISFAQDADAVLSKFFAVQVEETVFMRWTISAGNTCEDTHIERSSDGITYEQVGLIGGICGSPDEAITFEFTDSIPLVNRTLYYRLLLGYFGYTSPKVVEYRLYNDQGFLLAPNPFSDFTSTTVICVDVLSLKSTSFRSRRSAWPGVRIPVKSLTSLGGDIGSGISCPIDANPEMIITESKRFLNGFMGMLTLFAKADFV